MALTVCRALKVLCVAEDDATLAALKSAAVSAEWELVHGATGQTGALTQIDVERPHVLVAFGDYEQLIALTAERFPGIRIVADRSVPGVAAVAASLDEVRGLVKGTAPGGPVRSA